MNGIQRHQAVAFSLQLHGDTEQYTVGDSNSSIPDRSSEVEAGTESYPMHVEEQRDAMSHSKPTDDLKIESRG